MSKHYGPTVVTTNAVFMVDFSVPASVNTSTNNVFAYYANIVMTATNPSYVSVANGIVTYDRALTANSVEKPTAGGYHSSGNISTVPNIRYNEFYYTDHTFEVWVRPNDVSASNYDGTELNSFIAGHKGYNIGYTMGNGNLIYYSLWDNTTAFTVFNFSIPSEIQQGVWHQLVVTRSGTNYKKYLNGKYVANFTRAAPGINTGVSNSAALTFGAQGGSGNFIYYSKISIGAVRMYNRALDDGEILSNFAATRGKFGL